MSVAILLGTYQGAAWLPELLSSLLAQTHVDWVLYARDDGSTDETAQILRDFSKRSGHTVIILPAGAKPLGPQMNFSELLGAALQNGEKTFLFCDQDDIWLAQKIAKSVEALTTVGTRPALVHTDLSVVGPALEPWSPSFRRASHTLDTKDDPLPRLLAQNFVTGCTVALNRELAEIVYPVPPDSLMHDWWAALVAAAAGKILYLDEALVQYRQHGANASGGVGNSLSRKLRDFTRGSFRPQDLMRARVRQMVALVKRLESMRDAYPSSKVALARVDGLLSALDKSRLSALSAFWHEGVRLQGALRTALYYAYLLGQREQLARTIQSG